ncbi:MAG: TolC family outer membrane protein [Gammaproteobacteria bacterium]|nr:TolC family outer membrane protein [Gammaproteobacteria bacterium]MXW45321.1 TolC family outer membrane protein [Gammaproteobacteria bacterium]MYD01960.1 TolC family outer membrane protein [Gammaproteobacteria bacterium]MYI25516.1 TolC family outer membrane protein [Gammaproteobacteria bacterium]
MKKFILLAALAALTGVPLPGSSDNLLEVYEKARMSDPLLREAEARLMASREVRSQARSVLFPEIDANADYSRQDSRATLLFYAPTPTGEFAPIIESSTTDATSTAWSFTLRQTIFDWAAVVALGASNDVLAQGEADFEAALQESMLRTAQAYFAVLGAQDELTSQSANRTAIARQLEQAQKRFEVGLIAITDVQEAQAAHDQAVAAEIAAKRSLATSEEQLREIVGSPMPVASLTRPGEGMPLPLPSPNVEQSWIDTALQQNPSLISARMTASIADAEVRLRRSDYLPTLEIVANVNGSSGDRERVFRGMGADYRDSFRSDSIRLQLSVPIFDGFNRNSRVREARFLHRASTERLEGVERAVVRQTRDAFLGVSSEISRVNALRQAVASSQTALRATEAGYEIGTRTIVDVLDARRNLVQAETNYARSRYDFIINMLSLKSAAGILTEEDLAEVSGWMEQAEAEEAAQ